MAGDPCRCGSINVLVFLLVVMFGVSSWVDINGLWVELPILVQNLPEGWDLPSYMSVIIQVANIAPLIYTCVSTRWPHRMLELPVIYTIISLGGVACLLLAFLWGVTSPIAGREHSTALFVLQFCLALVDCTSSVAFLPFMSAFRPQYMTAYFIGEGFSGLIPSLAALAQGAGSMKCVTTLTFHNQSAGNQPSHGMNTSQFQNEERIFSGSSSTLESSLINTSASPFALENSVFPVYQEPRFSVKIFFLLLMLLMMLSAAAFTLLNFWSYCQSEKVVITPKLFKHPQLHFPDSDPSSICLRVDADPNEVSLSETATKTNGTNHTSNYNKNNHRYENENDMKSFPNLYLENNDSFEMLDDLCHKSKVPKMSSTKYTLFLLLTAYLNAISNGLLPSIQSYSCLPYGIEEYHLSVTLASIANPVACMASFLVKMTSVAWTVTATVIGSGLTCYIVWTAATSPSPPLVDQSAGPVILIISWVLVVFVLTYTKVAIATEFRQEGKRALLWVGASTQAGSLLGAVAIFVVVNVFKMFQAGNPCA